MGGVPQPRVDSSPLFVLAAATSLGILAGRYLTLSPKSFLVVGILVSCGMVLSIALTAKRKIKPASIFLIVAFFSTGALLSLIEERPMAPNRIARLYDTGA